MSVSHLSATNFKSFDSISVDLPNFVVLIGANGAGKSNFLQIFKFLRDIGDHGLSNAISLQGGIEYVRNIQLRASKSLSIAATLETDWKFSRQSDKRRVGLKYGPLHYEFELLFPARGRGFKIGVDKIDQNFEIFELDKSTTKMSKDNFLGNVYVTTSRDKNQVSFDVQIPDNVPLASDDFLPPFWKDYRIPTKSLLLETLFFPFPFPFPPHGAFSDISTFDFDPKLPKKAAAITGKIELEEDASNLALVLRRIRENSKEKRKFENLIKDILPFITDLGVERQPDKSLLFKMKEIYAPGTYLPAFSLSDGTVSIVALIVALYFDDNPILTIEEPDRRVHPHVIGKIIEFMQDVASKRQIIATTHNPQVLRHVNLENVLLVSRDSNGFSRILRPAESETVKIFLKNDIGIDDLYVQNLLEG